MSQEPQCVARELLDRTYPERLVAVSSNLRRRSGPGPAGRAAHFSHVGRKSPKPLR